MEEWDLDRFAGRLRRAAVQPSAWPDVLDELSRSFDGMGAQFFSRRVRLPMQPASPSLQPWMEDYFAEAWHERSERRPALELLQRGQVLVDQDFMTPDRIARSPTYQSLLRKHGMAWIACVGFDIGDEVWGLALHRPVGSAPFAEGDKRRLGTLAPHLSEAANLACHVNRIHADGVVAGCQSVCHPCVLFDDDGRVLVLNERAERLVGGMVDSAGGLRFADTESRSRFEACLRTATGRSPAAAAPIDCTLRDRKGDELAIQMRALDDPLSFPFIAARAMMLIRRSGPRAADDRADILARHGLTQAERLLVQALCSGVSLRQSAADAQVTYQTARSTLKKIFAKTNTHRQGELVAMLMRGKG